MTRAVDAALQTAFKARPYYDEKRYHTSFLTLAQDQTAADELDGLDAEAPPVKPGGGGEPRRSEVLQAEQVRLLEQVEKELNSKIGDSLRGLPLLHLDTLGIRVGPEVTWVSLGRGKQGGSR